MGILGTVTGKGGVWAYPWLTGLSRFQFLNGFPGNGRIKASGAAHLC